MASVIYLLLECYENDAKSQSNQGRSRYEFNTHEWAEPFPAGFYVQLRHACIQRVSLLEDKVVPAKEHLTSGTSKRVK